MASTAIMSANQKHQPLTDPGIPKGQRGWLSLEGNVTFSSTAGPRNYRKEAKEIWKKLDENNDGTLDKSEITQWVVENNVFETVSKDDQANMVSAVFDEIDVDGSGALEFEEFAQFYNTVMHEKSQMNQAALHHLVQLPQSYVKHNQKQFTTDAIEILLQEKIQAFTSADTDRFRQVLCMFKTQLQKAANHEQKIAQVITVNKREFAILLMWLGLFATRKQSDELFERYDADGSGLLTAYEFLTHARPKDYPGRKINAGEKYAFRTGKRMYLGDTLNGRCPRPGTPNDDVCHVSEKTLKRTIIERMGNAPGKAHHYIDTPLALNDLLNKFKFYDPDNLGYITQWQLGRALQNINISMGETHLALLVDKFNVRVDGADFFDYNRFANFVFPGPRKDATKPNHLSLNLRELPKYLPHGVSDQISSRPSARTLAARDLSARLKHTKRLHNKLAPISGRPSGRMSRGSSRGLAPSASMTQLNPISNRGMSRSQSMGHFVAPAARHGM